MPKWLQTVREQRKIKKQEELLNALRRPENQQRRPVAKFANKIGTK